MNAYVLEAVNQLVYKDVALPECPPGWAIIKVKAAGICSSDIPRIFKKGTYHFPTIPGHEFAGIVVDVNGDRKDLIGKHVGVFPLIPCKTCTQCFRKRYELCQNYDYIGSRRDGGFAEFVAVPIWNLIEVNSEVPFEELAVMEPLSVALHAVKQARIEKDTQFGIIGTGMIGFAAAQWAEKLGSSFVTVLGRSYSKSDIAEKLSIDYLTLENNRQKYDVVLEAVGSAESVNVAIEATKSGGTLILMGNPAGDILLKQDTYWQILRKQLTVKGTWNSSYNYHETSDWSEVVHTLETRTIQVRPLISHIFSQEKLAYGLDIMKNHTQPYCKIMTLWNED